MRTTCRRLSRKAAVPSPPSNKRSHAPASVRPINNARLVGVLIYRTHLDWFEQWHQSKNGDVREGVASLKTLMTGVSGDSAFTRLEAALRR